MNSCSMLSPRTRVACMLVFLYCTASTSAVLKQGFPPRGWNSYDGYTCTVTEDEVKANAEYMAEKLAKYGYKYIVIDYEWFRPGTGQFGCCGHQSWEDLVIDEYGRLQPCPLRFPSSKGGKGFRPLADYVHGLGLKFGIHIMRGIPRVAVEKNMPIFTSEDKARDAANETMGCGWCDDMWGVANNAAGLSYYNSLIQLYSEWTVDFIKMDCAYSPDYIQELEMVSSAIQNSSAQIALSMSPTNSDAAFAKTIKDDVTMYRINGDVWDNWNSIKSAFDVINSFTDFIGKPSYPDLDMLPLGHLSVRGGVGPSRQSSLTKDEQITLMTLWSIFRNPLIIGGDLPSLENDSFTTDLLTNEGILEMNLDGNNSHPVDTTLIPGNEPSTGLGVIVQQCQRFVPRQQSWSVNANGTITSLFNGYCLTVVNCATGNGTAVRMLPCEQPPHYTCQSGKNQLWSMNKNGTITSEMDGSCLDVFNFAGPTVDTWQCNGGHNQIWSFDSQYQYLHSEQQNMNVCLAIQQMGRAWASHGTSKEIFLALFNTEDVAANITVTLDDIERDLFISGCLAHNMWFGQEDRVVQETVFAKLPPHGAVVYNLTNCNI